MLITGNGVLFTNWSNEDYTWKFAGEPFTFPARSSTMITLGSQEHNLGLANLFAKHLVDREMDKLKLPTNHQDRHLFLDKCFLELPVIEKKEEGTHLSNEMAVPDIKITSTSEVSNIETTITPGNQTIMIKTPVVPKKKMGRPPKVKEEFEPAK